MSRRRLLALFLALALPVHAGAQHAHDHKPKHGGLVKEASGQVYELAVSATAITVWVTDEADKPVGTAGAAGTLTLIDSGSRVEIGLAPAGDNRLAATGNFAPRKGMSALLKVTVGGKEIARLRYVLK